MPAIFAVWPNTALTARRGDGDRAQVASGVRAQVLQAGGRGLGAEAQARREARAPLRQVPARSPPHKEEVIEMVTRGTGCLYKLFIWFIAEIVMLWNFSPPGGGGG